MKEFDVDKIGKRMPYKAPSEEFFANFQLEMLEKAEHEDRKIVKELESKKIIKTPMLRLLVPLAAAAASLMIGLFVVENVDYKSSSKDMGYLVSDNLDASMDAYFSSISDDELAYLLSNTSSQDDFYLTLPTNE
ncbi:MAG: hypothetical protein SNG10_06425 [Rikenellaceae bacterium]